MTISRWLALSLGLGFAATPAAAQKVDVVHFYTSTSESLAIGIFAKEYDKRGGTRVNDPFNWMFYSVKVFKEANMEPPKTWDEFQQEA